MKKNKILPMLFLILSIGSYVVTTYGETTRNQSKQSHSKKKSGKKKKGKSKSCPFGVGPMEKRICPAKKQAIIKKVAGARATCLGKLFIAESGCSETVYHNAKVAKNPHAGIGLCAIEKSPAVRRQNNRGKNCVNIKGFENQVRCCNDIVKAHGAAYFGTIKCGKAPRC